VIYGDNTRVEDKGYRDKNENHKIIKAASKEMCSGTTESKSTQGCRE
jgi:hypothetical protein